MNSQEPHYEKEDLGRSSEQQRKMATSLDFLFFNFTSVGKTLLIYKIELFVGIHHRDHMVSVGLADIEKFKGI